jgi:hypothetical protein
VGLVGPTPGHSDFMHARENSSADDSVASTSHGGSQEGQRGSGLQRFSDFNVNLLLFHLRHNHYNQAMCKRMSNAVDGAPSFPVGAKLDKCIGCLLGKCVAHSVPKKRENAKENEPLKRKLFTDWWGPFHNVYIHGLVDDGSGAAWVFFSKQKNGKIAAENLARVEAQLIAALPIGTIISVVNSDSDSVFAQGDFEAYCVARRHAQRFSAPYSQAQNGPIERFWRAMENCVAAALAYSGQDIKFWKFGVLWMVHNHNMCPPPNSEISRLETLGVPRPSAALTRVIFCPVWAKDEHTGEGNFKMLPKSVEGINLGVSKQHKDAYLIYMPHTQRIRVSRNVTFDEMWIERIAWRKHTAKELPALRTVGNPDYCDDSPKSPPSNAGSAGGNSSPPSNVGVLVATQTHPMCIIVLVVMTIMLLCAMCRQII